MEYLVDIPEYNQTEGIPLKWEVGFKLSTQVADRGVIIISANSQGLISLARRLLVLSQSSTPTGRHIHLDISNSLGEGSQELIIERE